MSSYLQSGRLSLLPSIVDIDDKDCMDLSTRYARCDTQFEPITREEARQRLKLQEESPSRVQRRGTPLNDPVIKARLIDETSLENKIIALDYRLKLDGCLQNQYFWCCMCRSSFWVYINFLNVDETQSENYILHIHERITEGILRPPPLINNKAAKMPPGWT